MDTTSRVKLYQSQGKLTPAKRRRMIQKAGRDPYAIVVKDDGMGYPPAMQGLKELVSFRRPEPGEPEPF
jgi:hypothetical protein